MKIFLSGSMSIKDLPNNWLSILEDSCIKPAEFLIGDAKGADAAIQKHFHDNGVTNVTVYHSTVKPRNNLGDFRTKFIRVEKIKIVEWSTFFTTKDEMMTMDADIGVVFWNGFSKGSKSNIKRLLASGKDACVFLKKKDRWTFTRLGIMEMNDWENILVKTNSYV